jgi:arylsulfatase A-like enzyme
LETLGLHRNVVVALVTSTLPRVAALESSRDWRASPFGSPRSEELAHLHGRATGRNVVVIHLESTGARYLRPYGAAEDPMPNLTRLCGRAILFENAYTTYPETIKSFFAAHCATFPALDTSPEIYAGVRTPALAEVLASAGYRCGLFHSGRFGYLGMDAVIRDRGFDTLEDAGAIGGEHDSSFGIDEPSTVRRILAWLDSLPPGQHFFVTYMPIAGHHPYATPGQGPFPFTDEIDRYRNALHYADRAVGELLDGLRKRRQYDDTLFVIFGDHGEAFGQHSGNFGHTMFIYDENVRVPFLVAAPGLIDEPVRIHRVASLADTAPTVLDLLGIPAPPVYQGRSLLDGRANLSLFGTDYALGLVGLRDGKWKAIHELDSGRTWLFDLQTDPDEAHDVAAEYPDRVDAYREHLLAWCAAQKYRIAHPPPSTFSELVPRTPGIMR